MINMKSTGVFNEQVKLYIQFLIASYEIESEEQVESLTFFRLLSFYRQIFWIEECIKGNAYHQAIRELRFMLDSLVQAYYVDKRHPTAKMQCKLEIVKELENLLYGSRMIEKAKFSKNQTRLLKQLYGELCAYVHSSYDELVSLRSKKTEKQIADLKFEHSDEMEGLCVSFANRTLDAIIFVALTRFPKILGEGTKYGKIKTRLQEAFRELEFKLASGKLR